MKGYTSETIRNVALLGHGGCGKTTFLEAALLETGVINKLGKIDAGNTVSDYDKMEIEKGFSINTSVVPIEWKDSKINFIDTPGYFDFVGEVNAALRASEAAVIMVDAGAGIQVGTEAAWKACERYSTPRFIVITKRDKDEFDFYKTFEEIKHQKYDGMIITGAPVEMLDFSEVNYWEELESIMDFANTNVYSTLFICWASQAALYYYYGVEKHPLEEKMFGIFSHQLLRVRDITKGFDDEFFAPHSRHTENRPQDLAKLPQLKILAQSDEAGVLLSATTDQRHYFISGHMEYDALTLKEEYERDLKKAQSGVSLPKAYFPHDDPSLEPIVKWRAHANLLYSNWLNHVVYQNTPYDLEKLQPREELI